jgi:hypothetical protein
MFSSPSQKVGSAASERTLCPSTSDDIALYYCLLASHPIFHYHYFPDKLPRYRLIHNVIQDHQRRSNPTKPTDRHCQQQVSTLEPAHYRTLLLNAPSREPYSGAHPSGALPTSTAELASTFHAICYTTSIIGRERLAWTAAQVRVFAYTRTRGIGFSSRCQRACSAS